MTKRWRWITGILLTIFTLSFMLYLFQEKLIFRSDILPREYEYGFKSGPEELFLKAPDDAVLNGLHFKREDPKGIILYFHGNKGQLDSWGAWAEILSEKYNYDVVAWDYRGYGKSTGKRNARKMLDDGFLFYEYCKSLTDSENILIFGRSLGGFFATHVASQRGFNKLILESTGTSLYDIAKKQYPFLPVKQFLKYRFQSIENMSKIKRPTYVIHGTEDGIIPLDHGKRLYNNSAANSKEFFSIQGAYHNDLRDFDMYFKSLDKILTK